MNEQLNDVFDETRKKVNDFAKSHANFNDVAPAMIGLIQSGETLYSAYEKAVNLLNTGD